MTDHRHVFIEPDLLCVECGKPKPCRTITAEERAVIAHAYHVSAMADSPRLGEELHRLDDALAALDRATPPSKELAP